jgi:hypothetical protein
MAASSSFAPDSGSWRSSGTFHAAPDRVLQWASDPVLQDDNIFQLHISRLSLRNELFPRQSIKAPDFRDI